MTLDAKQFEKLYIKLYNEVDKNGKCVYNTLQLKEKMGFTSVRSAERYEQQLRSSKKIKLRKDIESSFTIEKPDSDIKIIPVDWTIKKSTVKSCNNKGFKSYLVISDVHVPYQDVSSCKAILQLMDDVKFDGFVIAGDFMDMAPVSHWNKTKHLTNEHLKLREHYIEGNRLLDEFDKRLPTECDKRFILGNHEDFYNQFIEENPVLEGMLNPIDEVKFKERGYKVYDKINSFTKLGKLYVVHGLYTGGDVILKHLNNFSSNVMFGHTHQVGQKYKPCIGHTMALAGYNIGCLCNRNPDFMKNKPNNWVHSFAIVHVFDNEFFDVELKQIIDGVFVYGGKVYDGKQ